MKNNKIGRFLGSSVAVVSFLVLAVMMTSCFFESDDNGLETWLDSQGLPNSYMLQTLSINDLKPSSVEAFIDTFPKTADVKAVVGHRANLTHDLYLDFGFMPDSSFMTQLNESDSSGAFLVLFWLRPFYSASEFPADSLPFEEEMNVSLEWKIDDGGSKNSLDSITNITDSVWYKDLLEWETESKADTVFSMKMAKGDTSIRLELPSALVEALKKIEGAAHVQLRISAPEASREYRFYGDATSYPPILALYSDSSTFISPNPFRMANAVHNEEECKECPVLHGGVYDSLVIEIPPEPIMKALSEFYGDEFPYTKGDSNDVRQTVIMATLTMPRDDSMGENELGLPIQVVVGSYVDSANTVIRRMEDYRLNDAEILEIGHQNLVFHDGDSLRVQLTYGVRDFINKASDGRSLKFIMRLGYPFLQEKDTTYQNYRLASGDTSYVFFSYFDYARYDFSTAMESPMTLKLWLASKRGDEE